MDKEAYTYLKEDFWWHKVRMKIVTDLAYGKVLDVGCGTGYIVKKLNCYGLDNSKEAIKGCSGKVKLGDATNMPYGSEKFDTVFALDVLEHIGNDTLALEEIYRVLKHGGSAVITLPAFKFLWGVSDNLGEHYRRYTLGEITRKAERARFTVIRKTYFNTILFLPIFLARMLERLIRVKSENNMPQFLDKLFFKIFNLEYHLLKFTDFPFGVSCLVILQK